MKLMANSLLQLLFTQLCLTLIIMFHTTASLKFSSILIFGDSTVDTGNNNHLLTVFKANHHPYGIDFINCSATGRFSNGRLVPDFLASGLGIKDSVPPFLNPLLSGKDILTGVSFGSAGAGFDELTNAEFGVIPVLKQVDMFRKYLGRLSQISGHEGASNVVENALILISSGTNDFGFSYYDLPVRRMLFNISEYQDFIIQHKIQKLIKKIYKLGGRKFMVTGLGPIGCLPRRRNIFSHACMDYQSSDAIAYNLKLEKMVNKFQSILPGSKIAYVDVYGPAWDMLSHPKRHGLEEVTRGCCGTGLVEVGILCNQFSHVCPNRSEFMFWDSVHPAETVYRQVAKIMLDQIVPKLS